MGGSQGGEGGGWDIGRSGDLDERMEKQEEEGRLTPQGTSWTTMREGGVGGKCLFAEGATERQDQ